MALAAIYLRLSRNEEHLDIDEILTNHRNALVKVAEQHNLHYDIYREIGSGMNTERPQLNLLMQRIFDYDYVLVMDVDRLTRDYVHSAEIKQLLILNDIKILTPTGQINLQNESEELVYDFMSVLATHEYKQIRKRLGRGRLAAAEQGKWTMSNRVPLGYKKNADKRLEIVEDEAKIIRLIFQRTLARASANEIAKELDMLGWRSRNGKVLTSSHISLIRRNVVYYGVVQACRRVNGRVIDEVFVENAHEPIVSKQTFLEVQKLLEVNTPGYFFSESKVSRKLQNLIYCNCCGRKRYLQRDGNGAQYIKSCSYKVDNNICQDRGHKYPPVEHFVLQRVKERKSAFEQELAKLESLDTTDEEKKLLVQRQSLEKQLDRFNKRQRNLKTMRMDGEISKTEFYEMREENEEKIKVIQQQIELIDIQLESLSNIDQKQSELEYIISTLDRLEELDPEACNTFLKGFIKKIWFSSNTEANHDTTRERAKATIKIEWL